MKEKDVKQITLLVVFTLFWKALSFFTGTDIGIYTGLASIFTLIMFYEK